jgi:hypothetical protein
MQVLRQVWSDIDLTQCLFILFAIVYICSARFRTLLAEMGERFRNGPGPRGGHPVPVTGPVEKALWKGFIQSLRHR